MCVGPGKALPLLKHLRMSQISVVVRCQVCRTQQGPAEPNGQAKQERDQQYQWNPHESVEIEGEIDSLSLDSPESSISSEYSALHSRATVKSSFSDSPEQPSAKSTEVCLFSSA